MDDLLTILIVTAGTIGFVGIFAGLLLKIALVLLTKKFTNFD